MAVRINPFLSMYKKRKNMVDSEMVAVGIVNTV